jgi:hypothetical protein
MLYVVQISLGAEVLTTEYTQSGNGRFLAYILCIMMEKSALAGWGGGGGFKPNTFTLQYLPTHTKLQYTPAERADTLPLFPLYLYVLNGVDS